MIPADDRLQINEVLALLAYVADEGLADRVPEVFTSDAVYDMSSSGMPTFEGIGTITKALQAMSVGGQGPQAHFVTNVMIVSSDDDTAVTRSRGLMIMADGALHAVNYDDTLRRENGAWRIARRNILPVQARPGAAEGAGTN